MRVKICGVRNETELEYAVAAGADAVGFQVGQLYGGPCFILPSTALRLAGKLPPFVTPVLVTHLTRAEEVLELVAKSEIFTVQLLKPPLTELGRLREKLPRHAKIIHTEYVRYPVIDFDLSEYYPLIDAVNLDCANREPALAAREDTLKSCQWETARAFAADAPLPVILSGRLAPDNVADAIRQVGPFAVDACTRLRTPAHDLNPEAAREFAAQSLHAAG